MQGACEKRSVLWYWYDGWVAVPFLVIGVVLTIRLALATPRLATIPLISKLVAILGALSVALVALNRTGIGIIFTDPIPSGTSAWEGR